MTEREARHAVRNLQANVKLLRYLLESGKLTEERRVLAEEQLRATLDRIEQAKPYMRDEDLVILES